MARKVMWMKVIAAVTAHVAGEPVNVSRTCRSTGVSRKTFYKWAARYRAEGIAGLEERPRRPRAAPSRTPDDVELLIVAVRARLAESGLDHGARTVHWHLERDPAMRDRHVPSFGTVHRVLVRHGVVEPQPRKRPTSSWHRFEAPAPNEWWQIDATEWATAAGMMSVFNIIDDHSRVLTRSRAVTHATTAEAWTTFCQAAQQWGLPTSVLSDNGLCFSGKLRQFEVAFEANLRDAGIRPITSRPFHPQTTGKVERFQRTLKTWLRCQPLAATVEDLQDQLDRFSHVYNHERPHQGIGRVTPASRWHGTARSQPANHPLDHPVFTRPTIHTTKVCSSGNVRIGRALSIGLGAPYIGTDATVIIDEHHATVFVNDQLVRHLTIDHTRYYQPTGRPRGGTRQPRIAS